MLDGSRTEQFHHHRKRYEADLGQRERENNISIVPLFQWQTNHDYFIVSCKLSPNGKYVAISLDVDRGICIMDAENTTILANIKGEVAQLPAHSVYCRNSCLSLDG